MNIEGICTEDPPMRFYCLGHSIFSLVSVLWGSIGDIKVFDYNGQYAWLLMGIRLGTMLVLEFWTLKSKCRTRVPRSRFTLSP